MRHLLLLFVALTIACSSSDGNAVSSQGTPSVISAPLTAPSSAAPPQGDCGPRPKSIYGSHPEECTGKDAAYYTVRVSGSRDGHLFPVVVYVDFVYYEYGKYNTSGSSNGRPPDKLVTGDSVLNPWLACEYKAGRRPTIEWHFCGQKNNATVVGLTYYLNPTSSTVDRSKTRQRVTIGGFGTENQAEPSELEAVEILDEQGRIVPTEFISWRSKSPRENNSPRSGLHLKTTAALQAFY